MDEEEILARKFQKKFKKRKDFEEIFSRKKFLKIKVQKTSFVNTL